MSKTRTKTYSDLKDERLDREAELVMVAVKLRDALAIWSAGKCPANIWHITRDAFASYEKAGLK